MRNNSFCIVSHDAFVISHYTRTSYRRINPKYLHFFCIKLESFIAKQLWQFLYNTPLTIQRTLPKFMMEESIENIQVWMS